MGIQPELNFFLIFRSILDLKSVYFYSMNEKYGYKNFYKIAAITQYLGVVTVNVIGTVPTFKMHNVGTPKFYDFF